MGTRRVEHDWATSHSLFTSMHWRRQWQPTPVFLPGESPGRRSLGGCRLGGRTESGTTEAARQQLSFAGLVLWAPPWAPSPSSTITTVSQSPNNSLTELEWRVEHWGQWSLPKSLSKADLSQETRTFCLTLALTPRPPPSPSVSKASLRRRPWRHFRRLGQARPASRARGSLWPPYLRKWGGPRAGRAFFPQPTLSSGKHSSTPTYQARRGESSENLAPSGFLSAFRSSEELQGRRGSTRWPHRPPVCFFCGQAGGRDQTLPSYSCLWCVCV